MGPRATSRSTQNRQAIGPNYVSEIQKGADGKLSRRRHQPRSRTSTRRSNLDGEASNPYFAQPVSRDFPACP